jgi:hypothetical protein
MKIMATTPVSYNTKHNQTSFGMVTPKETIYPHGGFNQIDSLAKTVLAKLESSPIVQKAENATNKDLLISFNIKKPTEPKVGILVEQNGEETYVLANTSKHKATTRAVDLNVLLNDKQALNQYAKRVAGAIKRADKMN